MYLVPDSCAPTGEVPSKLRRLIPGLQRHRIRCFEQFPSQTLITQCVRSSAVGTCQCHWTRELFTRCRHWTQERFSKFQVFQSLLERSFKTRIQSYTLCHAHFLKLFPPSCECPFLDILAEIPISASAWTMLSFRSENHPKSISLLPLRMLQSYTTN